MRSARPETGEHVQPVLGENYDVFAEAVVALHAGAQETLAAADPDRDGDPGRIDCARARLGRGTVHLHAVLRERRRLMRIVGISAFYHDSAVALVADGEIVAAAQEERFTRKKHDAGFPRHALEYCLSEGGIGLDQVDLVAFYDKPFLKFERLLETYLAFAPRGFASFRMAIPIWLREKLFLKDLLQKQLEEHRPDFYWYEGLVCSEHHLRHAANAFFASPFKQAAVLCMDGVGECATTSLGLGQGNKLEMLKEIHFPHSLGL